MRTKLLVIIAFLLSFWMVKGQKPDFQMETTGIKKILIEQIPGKLMLENTKGTLLRIVSDQVPPATENDDRAEGLKPLSGGSLDNTGLGLEVQKAGDNITITGSLNKHHNNDARYTIFIPENMSVSVDYASPFGGEEIRLKGLSGPIEIRTLSANILFSDINGPALFHSISGNIEGSFGKFSQEAPTSIYTVSGIIDVAFPPKTAMDLITQTISGQVYTGFEMEVTKPVKKEKEKELPRINIPGGITRGTINGGGVKLSLQSISGNIYLRSL